MTRSVTTEEVRQALIERREIALLDLREEAPFAEAHPLFAASLSLGNLELEVLDRIPRLSTPIVVYDDGEGLVGPALERLAGLGYTDVSALDGGLAGWRAAGGEVFRDVNAPSKAFGELVESRRHTPGLDAAEVKALIDQGADIVILDARRFDEYQTMSIPSGISVPGAELVLRVRDLAPRPETRVIVNCAGRTRSLIGAQSLVNAGIPNPVAALRNGTIGWTLAGFPLEKGQDRRHGAATSAARDAAIEAARSLAARAGVRSIAADALGDLPQNRTIYYFDVRTPEEYAAGHPSGFRSAPGGQLVQETDVFAPVRGALIVLADDDGVRANMTGSWLAQMGWEVKVLADAVALPIETGPWRPRLPHLPPLATLTPVEVQSAIRNRSAQILDLGPSRNYANGHIPGAWFALRSDLAGAIKGLPQTGSLVLTSPDGILAVLAASEAAEVFPGPVRVLGGGTEAWKAAGLRLETGLERLASPLIDRYRRPYEGTDNPRAAMQAYLDWEFGLVAQLARDGTHGFFVI